MEVILPRKRVQNRPRYPSGKLKPEGGTLSPTMVRRMIDQVRRDAANPLLGSQLGLLRLSGVLTDREMSAGVKYAEVVGRYFRLKGLPSPSVKSPSYQRGFGLSLAADPDPEAIARAEKNYKSARAALERFGKATLNAVESVAVFDASLASTSHAALTSGLSMLAQHFGLTGRAR